MPVGSFTFPQADLRVAVADAPDPVLNGAPLAYAVTVANDGPDAAADVTFSQTLPAGLTFGSLTAPPGWTCRTPAAGAAGTVSCAAPGLAAGGAATFSVVAFVPCDAPDGSTAVTTAAVSAGTDDPNPANDTTSNDTTISNPPPVVSDASADPPVLWPPNHKLVDVTVLYTVADQCSEGTQCVLSVTSNEDARRGAGRRVDHFAPPDWLVVDATHVRLRAEHGLFGRARVYTITITCTDSAGGQSSRQVQVRVPHSLGGPRRNDRGMSHGKG